LIKKFKKKFAAAGFAIGIGCLPGAPAQAATCTGNGTNTASFSLAFLTDNPSLTCTVGDVTYSNFSFTGFAASDVSQNAVNISASGVGGLQKTIGMQNTSGWTSASNTFTYTVSRSSGTRVFDLWAATGASSVIGSAFTSTVTATNSSPSPNPNGAVNAFSTVGSPSTFTAGISSATFTNTFAVTSASFTSFDNTFTQKAVLPGPLPILGAAAAFRFARRLRKRSSTAAQI